MARKNPLFLTGFVLLWTVLDYELAEGAGFEPANLSVNGFQDRRHRPLGHPSAHCACYPAAGILSTPPM